MLKEFNKIITLYSEVFKIITSFIYLSTSIILRKLVACLYTYIFLFYSFKLTECGILIELILTYGHIFTTLFKRIKGAYDFNKIMHIDLLITSIK